MKWEIIISAKEERRMQQQQQVLEREERMCVVDKFISIQTPPLDELESTWFAY